METPYHSRAIINPTYNGMEITIPPKKDTFVPAFLIAAFVGFLLLEFFDPNHVFHSAENGRPDVDLMIRLTAIAFGIFLAGALWLWYLSGKEVITFAFGELTIYKERSITKAKTYTIKEAYNFRAVKEKAADLRPSRHGYRRLPRPWKIVNSGTIHFDYGPKIIQFGRELDLAEAEYILGRLREKGVIG